MKSNKIYRLKQTPPGNHFVHTIWGRGRSREDTSVIREYDMIILISSEIVKWFDLHVRK